MGAVESEVAICGKVRDSAEGRRKMKKKKRVVVKKVTRMELHVPGSDGGEGERRGRNLVDRKIKYK